MQPTVPLQIDAGSNKDPLIRGTYFCVDCQVPQPNWLLRLDGANIPIFLIGISGIILSPIGGGTFTQPRQIDELFEFIENMPGFSVEVNDIWIPTFVFRNEVPNRGDICRMDLPLFQWAFAQRVAWNPEHPNWREYSQMWHPSPEESSVFRAWEERTRAAAQEQYPKDKELALRWRNDDPDGPTKGGPLGLGPLGPIFPPPQPHQTYGDQTMNL
jgi:hypothetical protein